MEDEERQKKLEAGKAKVRAGGRPACAGRRWPVQLKIAVNGVKPGWLDYDAMVPRFSTEFSRLPDQRTRDTMLVFFSSGTTGYPKMVEHDFAYPLGHIMTARHWHRVDPDGLHFTVADTGWGKALWGKIYGQPRANPRGRLRSPS